MRGSRSATALHVVDPKNPGAVDEIVHLGDFWDEGAMRSHREAILSLNREVGRLFRHAYGYLAQARILSDELESYYLESGALNLCGLDRTARRLEESILGKEFRNVVPKRRHLFASAIAPEGAVNYLEDLFSGLSKRYILEGPGGTGKSTIVDKIYRSALGRGFDVEAFHCSLRPEEVEHLIIPQLDVGIIVSETPHPYEPAPGDSVIDTQQFVNEEILSAHSGDMARAARRFEEAFLQAVFFINRAKKAHDAMEEYYVPHMDFDAINACREKILERIRGYYRAVSGVERVSL